MGIKECGPSEIVKQNRVVPHRIGVACLGMKTFSFNRLSSPTCGFIDLSVSTTIEENNKDACYDREVYPFLAKYI